jgi:S-adenosylmethionine synthetase
LHDSRLNWRQSNSVASSYIILFQIVLLGETSITPDQVNFEQVARDVCQQVGYTSEAIGLDCANCQVITNIQAQDANIAASVHGNKDESEFGAGD